jgi:DNA repair exonuclease SbcCD ATPase subunit
MYVNIVTQTKDTKGAWKETFEIEIVTQDGVRSFSALSGGEKFRVTFSMRLALNQLLAKRMGGEVQMLLLDEVSSSLDPEGLEVFISMIKRLERDVKVLIITHDDRLKDAFDHAILVEMTEAGSVVSQ